ncbi:MAG: sugar ABC transporter permease [Eubacteriales bacterium]|nr:sugar ABC transporter permease [Eubacteriales bacterium]
MRRRRRERPSRRRKGARPGRILFLLPSLLGVGLFVLLPFGDVVRRSFLTAVTGRFAGLSNYRTVFSNEAFRLAAGNTLKFTAVCVPLLVGAGLLLAVQIGKAARGELIRSLYLLPMAIPAAAVALFWKMLFSDRGLWNGWLSALAGQTVSLDYMNTQAAFWVLVFSYLWKNLGYTVVLWMAGLHCVPKELCEAAGIDGASERQCFWRVVFPNLKGSLYTITVLSFLNAFKVFREAYLVAGSYPHESIYLLQHLFNNWFVHLELDKLAAAAVCVSVFLLAFILLLQRLWEGEN